MLLLTPDLVLEVYFGGMDREYMWLHVYPFVFSADIGVLFCAFFD